MYEGRRLLFGKGAGAGSPSVSQTRPTWMAVSYYAEVYRHLGNARARAAGSLAGLHHAQTVNSPTPENRDRQGAHRTRPACADQRLGGLARQGAAVALPAPPVAVAAQPSTQPR